MGFLDDLFGDLLGGDSGDAAKYMADKQWEVANKIQLREELLFGMWYYDYRPYEIAIKDRIFAMPRYEPQYERMHNEGATHAQGAFFRADDELFEFISRREGRVSPGMTQSIQMAEAGIGAWIGNSLMRMEESRKITRNQRRREEQYRIIALYHKNYFSTHGAEIAIQAYGQAASMAMKQQSDRSSAMGYYLQQIVGFGGRAGWFGESSTSNTPAYNASLYGQPASNYSLSGQGPNAASDTQFIDIPGDNSAPEAQPTTGISQYDYSYTDNGMAGNE